MFRMVTATFAALISLLGPATAQDYPTRPITMVIPFAAGGPTDVLGRVVADDTRLSRPVREGRD